MNFVINPFARHGRYSKSIGLFLILPLLLLGLLGVAESRAQALCPSPYVVQSGDSWFKIARRCGVSFEALRDANLALWQRQGETLYIGDQLQMPSALPPTVTPGYTPAPTLTPVNPGQNARETVRSFWSAVVDGVRRGDFQRAYGYLSPRLQGATPYPAFVATFAGVREVTISSIATIQESGSQATVEATIVFAEQTTSGWQYKRHRYRYTLLLVNGQWRIDTIESQNDTPPANCAPPTRLQRGMRAYVLPQPPTPNRVFREANRQSQLVGRIYPGEQMTLIDGPRCVQNSYWWYVQGDNGVIGWTAEGQPGEYWLAPVTAPPPPPGRPSVGPITFCTTVDAGKRCIAPTAYFPIGLQRIEVNWTFQNLPIGTPITHIWYHNGRPFFTRSSVIWGENRTSTTGFGCTFFAPLGGLPTGQWRLEFRRQSDNQLLQQATFQIGPTR